MICAVWGFLLCLMLVVLVTGVIAYRRFGAAWVNGRQDHSEDIGYEASDPWTMQRALMLASGQFLPDAPSVNKTSVLYLALQLEEAGELIAAVLKPMMAWGTYSEAVFAPDESRLIRHLMEAQSHCAVSSKSIRLVLEKMVMFEITPTADEAAEILDGVTDGAVVNAGFCLASGMPGRAAYAEVQGSNLSKRNDSGVIDKTPDGKWIKSENYRPPDLARVLCTTAAARAR